MSKAYGRVAVLMGGDSNERSVSLNSGASVLAALKSSGVDAHAFDPAIIDILQIREFDRVFNVMHGRGGEDGQIQGLLDYLKVPYTGSGVMASAIGMDKVRTKQLWAGGGIATKDFALMQADTDFTAVAKRLGLPLIVKPVREGSSVGMSKVNSIDELKAAYLLAAEFDPVVMAESWITGSEYTSVIIGDEVYPLVRLEPAIDADFYDFEAKYERSDTQYGIPSGLSAELDRQAKALCLRAFRLVGASGWGRVDFMKDEQDNLWLLEINTVPGMTDHSLVPMSAKAAGLDFAALCLKLLDQTL